MNANTVIEWVRGPLPLGRVERGGPGLLTWDAMVRSRPALAPCLVALGLWVGVDGRDEAPAERGLSHLAERMRSSPGPAAG
jgi:hypothetical protein